MKLLIAGGDARAAYAAAEAARRGLDIAALGLEKSTLSFPRAELGDAALFDAVLMANPWRSAFPGPLGAPLNADELLSRLRPDAALVLPDALQKPASFTRPMRTLSDSEAYLLKNARLTAEGTLSILMNRSEGALCAQRALILGYGRIGRALGRLLKATGGTVCAATRRSETRRMAREDGLIACGMDALGEVMPHFDLIINTVPHRVIDDDDLTRLDRQCLLIDVASAPYGFSLEKALSLKLQAARENNLPGRCCPQTAGEIQLDTFLELLRTA